MAEQDPRLRAALANANKETADAVSSLRSMTASIRKEHEEFKKERDKRSAAREKAAREGELGPDMQRLQQRVDLHQTSWDDVLEGRDEHPSAARARAHVREGLRSIGEEVQRDPDFLEEDLEARATQARVEGELRGGA